MKWQWQLAANENVNENFHLDNYQLSIVNCQFAAPQHCHATPKINFCHLRNAHFVHVIHPKMPIPSAFY